MNTINAINAIRTNNYINLKNNSNAPITSEQPVVSFKGALGDSLLKEVSTSGVVPKVETIFSKIKGAFGFNSDKTKDVIESFVELTKNLVSENRVLTSEKANLNSKLNNVTNSMKTETQRYMERERGFARIMEQKDDIIRKKDAEIAELSKYKKLADVKPIEELGLVMPEEVKSTLGALKASNNEAHQSLLEYVMTGKGQEPLLEQIQRNNVILKSYKDEMHKVPEVKEAIANAQKEGAVYTCNNDMFICNMLENGLSLDSKGDLLHNPKIFKTVQTNVNALLEAIGSPAPEGVEKSLKKILEFRSKLGNTMNTMSESGYKYISETKEGFSHTNSYRTFLDKDGNYRDIALSDLAYGWLGCARIKTPNGEIIRDNSRMKR